MVDTISCFVRLRGVEHPIWLPSCVVYPDTLMDQVGAISIHCTMCIQVYFTAFSACFLSVEHCAMPFLRRCVLLFRVESTKRGGSVPFRAKKGCICSARKHSESTSNFESVFQFAVTFEMDPIFAVPQWPKLFLPTVVLGERSDVGVRIHMLISKLIHYTMMIHFKDAW